MNTVDRSARIRSVIADAVRRDLPVVVGPWMGEVGFELLYWVPFVRWVVETHGVPPDRVVVISRGGTASWYGADIGRYVDVFTLCSPSEYREGNAGLKAKQSIHLSEFADELVTRAATTFGLGDEVTRLHPHYMYRLIRPFLDGLQPIDYLREHSSYARIVPPAHSVLQSLPAEFVAVRFYISRSFPDTPPNHAYVNALIDALVPSVPVVVLTHGMTVDDHRDVAVRSDRAITIQTAAEPAGNLAIQTAVIGRARAFVGTYGGLSYLAPLCGRPCVALYSQPKWKRTHLQVARWIFAQIGGGQLSALQTSEPDARIAAVTARITDGHESA